LRLYKNNINIIALLYKYNKRKIYYLYLKENVSAGNSWIELNNFIRKLIEKKIEKNE